MKQSSYEKAVALRTAGYSYSYISKETGIGKGTLSYWLATIPYSPNKETVARIGKARAASGLYKSLQKQQSLTDAIKQAKKDVGVSTKRDLFMLGLGIYIGEGTKTGDQIRVVNSDPMVIKASIRWFTEICGLSSENLTARIHGYPDTDQEKARLYWAKTLRLPMSCFMKTQIDHRIDKTKIRAGKLPFGTLHLTIRSNGKKEFGVFLARRINAWMSLVLQKAGMV